MVTVPDWMATKMRREMRALVLRIVVVDEARERVKTREKAMRTSATELETSHNLDGISSGIRCVKGAYVVEIMFMLRSAYVARVMEMTATEMPPANYAGRSLTLNSFRCDNSLP